MTRRFLILSFAVGLLALVGQNVRAGTVPLPNSLATLEIAGNNAIVGNLEFSDFSYIPSNVVPGGPAPPPTAANVTVSPFSILGETGITFTGGFFAPAGSIYDYAISYHVTALSGTITDAYAVLTGGNFGGTGAVSAGETITTLGGALVVHFEPTIPGGPVVGPVYFPAPETSLIVTKDILIVGGSLGATVSIISQGFSSTTIPEPTSMALLGIGLSGLFTLRRFLRRTSVA